MRKVPKVARQSLSLFSHQNLLHLLITELVVHTSQTAGTLIGGILLIQDAQAPMTEKDIFMMIFRRKIGIVDFWGDIIDGCAYLDSLSRWADVAVQRMI